MPEELKKAFWDADISSLDIEENKAYIISRILTHGTADHYEWLFATYDDNDFIYVARKSRNLDDITANYLKKKYNLTEAEMPYYTARFGLW